MLPPPITSSLAGSESRSQTVSLVRVVAPSRRPGTGGTAGAAPVHRRARRKPRVFPSTSSEASPVKRARPVITWTPLRRSVSGESTGAISAIDARTPAITSAKSTETSPTSMPLVDALRADEATAAAAMRALLGTHPVHRQSPPVRSLSTSATRAPSLAAVVEATMPAVPPPTTTRSQGVSVTAGPSGLPLRRRPARRRRTGHGRTDSAGRAPPRRRAPPHQVPDAAPQRP